MRSRIPRAAGLALFLAVPSAVPAGASAAPAFEDRAFAVEITGIQTIDWRSRSSWPLDDDAGWTTQDGTQTLGWQTTRKGRIDGTRYRRRRLGTVTMPPFAINWVGRQPRIKATVKRVSAVQAKDPNPVCEGGTLDPECVFVPLTHGVPQTCGGQRAVRLPVTIGPAGEQNERLRVATVAEVDELYPQCGPSGGLMALRQPGPTAGTRVARDDLQAEFRAAARRLGRLRRGGRLTLRHRADLGCPLPPAVTPGVVESCVTTDITVELTRTR